MSRNLRLKVAIKGQRLDVFLAESLPQFSRSRLQRLIGDGRVMVDERPARASYRLSDGQLVVVNVPDPEPARMLPQPIQIEVVHEDRDVVVVDKPPGLTVHPSAGQPDGTMANALLALYPDLEGVGGPERAGIVHRLDKGTSGLLVVARNEGSHDDLSRQFRERRVSKRYLALVEGAVAPPEGVIEAPLGRHPRNRKRVAPVSSGRHAATPYRVVASYRGYTLVEASPLTGRTHQIRVHFSSVGHPLAGDLTYGRRHRSLDRQFLHASRLGFQHPGTGEPVEFRSELPADLRRFLGELEPVLAQ